MPTMLRVGNPLTHTHVNDRSGTCTNTWKLAGFLNGILQIWPYNSSSTIAHFILENVVCKILESKILERNCPRIHIDFAQQ